MSKNDPEKRLCSIPFSEWAKDDSRGKSISSRRGETLRKGYQAFMSPTIELRVSSQSHTTHEPF